MVRPCLLIFSGLTRNILSLVKEYSIFSFPKNYHHPASLQVQGQREHARAGAPTLGPPHTPTAHCPATQRCCGLQLPRLACPSCSRAGKGCQASGRWDVRGLGCEALLCPETAPQRPCCMHGNGVAPEGTAGTPEPQVHRRCREGAGGCVSC